MPRPARRVFFALVEPDPPSPLKEALLATFWGLVIQSILTGESFVRGCELTLVEF